MTDTDKIAALEARMAKLKKKHETAPDTVPLFVIRQASTGLYFQCRGLQGSWQEPAEGNAYRFWRSLRSARSWVTTWCKGGQYWTRKDCRMDFEGIESGGDHYFSAYGKPRDRSDFEIFECELTLGAKR